MPGIFDGMQVAKSGLLANRVLQEVVSQNIAGASNKDYTRQSARLTSVGSQHEGNGFLGQGVEVAQIVRVRDTLLDDQLRASQSSANTYQVEAEWLQKIQAVFNEPSDSGINASLTKFWEGWAELASTPESFASRSTVMSRTQNLTNILRDADSKLENFESEVQQSLVQTLDEINDIAAEIVQVNNDIFEIEAGRTGQANDLHDKRDAALDRLSEKVDIQYNTAKNGMVNVFIDGHPLVLENNHEKLELKANSFDASQMDVMWEYGDRLGDVNRGELAGILNVRDVIVPGYREQLDSIAKTLMDEVNRIYANGVGTSPEKTMESRFGYEQLGASSASDALELVPTGEHGSLHISFYNAAGEIVRSAGILIDSEDSLTDIATKLDAIDGVDASLLGDPDIDGRLRIRLDEISGENSMGEVGLAISNSTGGYDTSGFLDLLGFDQTAKSSNSSASAPLLESRDLTELQTVLGEPSLADVRSTALGLAGRFTINAFETLTETAPKTNGRHVQQLSIEVESSDSIDDVVGKINALTAQYGLSATINGTSNKLEITTTAETDAEGNVTLAGGTANLRLSFANDYRSPEVPDDEPPEGYEGRADSTGLLAMLQMNTLLQGTGASDIRLDSRIRGAEDIHAGSKLTGGSNDIALALNDLQHQRVAVDGNFTLGQEYQNLVAGVGADIQHSNNQFENESMLLESFVTEKERISGVNLDEELGNMILFQRAFDANSRMLATWNQMTQELLNIV